MGARGHREILVPFSLALVLWSVGFVPLIADRGSPAAAAQPACITLPDRASSAAREHNPRVCPPVTTYLLRTTDAQSADPGWKTSYSANTTYELFFAFDVGGVVTGTHAYTLFIFMPSGFAYQAIQVTYTSTTCTPIFGSACSVDQTSGGIRVWTSIPVAGTMIQQFQIYGTWAADAYIDGATSPTATTSFHIGP